MTAVPMEDLVAQSEVVPAVRKTLAGLLFIGNEDAPEITKISTDGVTLDAIPEGYVAVGLLTDDGLSAGKEMSMADVTALNHFSPVRRDPESGTRTVSFTAYEIHRPALIEIMDGVDLSAATVDPTTGSVSWEESEIPQLKFKRALWISFDGNVSEPIYDARFWPKVQVTSFPTEAFTKSDARKAEIELTVYTDDELGFPVRKFIAGKGFVGHAEKLGWTAGV